jgi:hypothetical protein
LNKPKVLDMALIQASEITQGGVARPGPTDIRMDNALLSPHIQAAEWAWVAPILGDTFYDALQAEKGNSSAFTTSAYQTLWDTHLKALCSNASIYEAAPFVVMQLGSNGLYLNSQEYGSNVGIDGVKFYQDTLRTRIARQQERMKDWLCTCAANLPAFNSSAMGCPSGCDSDATPNIYNALGLVI